VHLQSRGYPIAIPFGRPISHALESLDLAKYAEVALAWKGQVREDKAHLEQQLENRIRLLIFQANDPLGEARVDKQCLLARGRMNPHDRVISLDRFPANRFPVTACIFSLRESAMLRSQPLQQLLDRVREAFIRYHLRRPASIPSSARDLQQCQNSDSRRLMFVRDI